MPASLRSTQMRKVNVDKCIVKHPQSLYTIKQIYELQLRSLLYNNGTCLSVCLHMCPCHFLSRPSITQLNYQVEHIKNETSPTIPRGMDEYLHDQNIYAYAGSLSELQHNHIQTSQSICLYVCLCHSLEENPVHNIEKISQARITDTPQLRVYMKVGNSLHIPQV